MSSNMNFSNYIKKAWLWGYRHKSSHSLSIFGAEGAWCDSGNKYARDTKNYWRLIRTQPTVYFVQIEIPEP